MNTFKKSLLIAAPTLPMVSKATDIDFYGFIKASVSSASEKVNSFGQDTLTAPTDAGRNDTDPEKKARLAFQSAHSRFGLNIKVNDKISGKFELDYGQITQSTPTLTTPRARIAQITYQASDTLTIRVGKGWALAAGLSPHSYNFVANGYRSGNSVFLAEELSADYMISDTFSAALAIGNVGANNSTVNAKEMSAPSTSARFEWKTDSCRLGVAHTGGSTDYTKNGGASKRSSNVTKLYYQHTDSWYNARLEYYIGQNSVDLSANGITTSSNTATDDQKENGAFLSAEFNAGANGKIHIGYGFAQADNKDDAVFSGGDVIKNTSTRLGYGHALGNGLSVIAEHTAYATEYKGDKEYTAGVTEVGMILRF